MKTLFLLCALMTALAAAAELPWTREVPPAIAQDALTPDTVFDETPGDWRPTLRALFEPLVADCTSAREATLKVAANMTSTTGVYYSRERRKPMMTVQESLAEKKVSCTGQSVLLVCALRSVGIPARAVGVLSWGHVRGNHTWVEAWFDGAWHMIEFNEKDFNTPWVMENIGMLNPAKQSQRIYAVTQQSTGLTFPTYWNRRANIPAEDVTDRYLALSRAWYEQAGLPADCQRLMVDISPRPAEPITIELRNDKDEVLQQTTLPTAADDVRNFAKLNLPRTGSYKLRIQGYRTRVPVRATDAPVQIRRLKAPKKA